MSVPDEFRYLLDTAHYLPRTPSAALRAVEGGYLPEAAFIFQGVNVRPAFEEPYDLMELERLLAKPDLEFDSTLLLMQVFEKLIKNPDKELALFAAESINAIEVRRVHRIQGLKKTLDTDPSPEVRHKLVDEFFELGRLSFNRPVLKNFIWRRPASCSRPRPRPRGRSFWPSSLNWGSWTTPRRS